MSYGVEAQGSGETEWSKNALFFETEEEADGYARNLFMRWFGCDATRSYPSDNEVNYRWTEDGLQPVKKGEDSNE